LTAWKDLLKSAALIFVSASKFDEHTLFDGKAAPLAKSDPRVRWGQMHSLPMLATSSAA